MSDKVCHWNNDDASVIIHNKKAIEACLFLMFIYYSAFVFFTVIKRTSEKGIVFKRYLNDIAYSHIFFFICALIIHNVVPRVFPIVLLYTYMVINFVHPSFIKEKNQIFYLNPLHSIESDNIIVYKMISSRKLAAFMDFQILQAIYLSCLFSLWLMIGATSISIDLTHEKLQNTILLKNLDNNNNNIKLNASLND